jgi:hypothetical protein
MAKNDPKLRSYITNTTMFSLSCAAVMIHFVFSRAFRDSLLGSDLPIRALPRIVLIGTAIALVLSFLLSWLFRHGGRSNVIRSAYLLSASAELFLAFGHFPPRLVYEAFYLLVSASTAIGLSMVWILANNWMSDDLELKSRAVPILLVAGTVGGLLAGFGLVHLRFAESFAGANIFLAGIDILTAAILCLHREPTAAGNVGLQRPRPKSAEKLGRARVVARALAAATVLGATGSTLLDLTYRISAAQQYSSQVQLLHFFGHLQAALGAATVLAQLGLSRYKPRAQNRSTMVTYAILEVMAGGLAIIVPSFALLTAMRTGEYALRNSFFRFGKEMTYSELPNRLRLEARPLIDVAGERIGDGIAAGLLQSLFWLRHGLSLRMILILLTVVACLLWKVCDRIAKITGGELSEAAGQPLPQETTGILLNASRGERPVVRANSHQSMAILARGPLCFLLCILLLVCALGVGVAAQQTSNSRILSRGVLKRSHQPKKQKGSTFYHSKCRAAKKILSISRTRWSSRCSRLPTAWARS